MPLIEINHLKKSYFDEGGTATHALRDVSFSIEKGEFVSIMGPSGSGKSTLLHILGFLDDPTGGEYIFNGKKSVDYTKDEVAFVRNRKIGFIFQAFNLLPRTTVLENVKLPLLYSDIKESKWDKMAIEAIESVGLGHRIHYDSSRLSGGERQRVAIARALVNNPDVVFADEPTGNLDSKSGQIVMEIIQKLNKELGHTVILITHETATAENAQRILQVYDGEIISDKKVAHQRSASKGYSK